MRHGGAGQRSNACHCQQAFGVPGVPGLENCLADHQPSRTLRTESDQQDAGHRHAPTSHPQAGASQYHWPLATSLEVRTTRVLPWRGGPLRAGLLGG